MLSIGKLLGVPVDALVNGDSQSPPEEDAQAAEDKPEEAKPEAAKLEEDNPEETKPEDSKPEAAKLEEDNPEEAKAEDAKPETAAPKEAEEPPQVILPKPWPRRWVAAACAGVVCALLLGIMALIEVHSLKQRLEPDNAVPEEQVEREEVDESIISGSFTLHP